MKLSNLKNRSRTSALRLLEKQLASGVKPLRVDGKTTKETTELTDKDKSRIQKEIEILKSRVVLS